MNAEARQAVAHKPSCWLARFDDGPCLYRSDGLPDRCHLIPKGRLARGGVADVWAQAWWVPGCRRHHHLFDAKVLRLAEADYPLELREAAARFGFGWVDDRYMNHAARIARSALARYRGEGE